MEKAKKVPVHIYQGGGRIEAVTMVGDAGHPIAPADATRWLDQACGDVIEWTHIATIEVTIESVTTTNVTAKVVP